MVRSWVATIAWKRSRAVCNRAKRAAFSGAGSPAASISCASLATSSGRILSYASRAPMPLDSFWLCSHQVQI